MQVNWRKKKIRLRFHIEQLEAIEQRKFWYRHWNCRSIHSNYYTNENNDFKEKKKSIKWSINCWCCFDNSKFIHLNFCGGVTLWHFFEFWLKWHEKRRTVNNENEWDSDSEQWEKYAAISQYIYRIVGEMRMSIVSGHPLLFWICSHQQPKQKPVRRLIDLQLWIQFFHALQYCSLGWLESVLVAYVENSINEQSDLSDMYVTLRIHSHISCVIQFRAFFSIFDNQQKMNYFVFLLMTNLFWFFCTLCYYQYPVL